MVYNAAWLVEKLGPPPCQVPIKFHVEYITTGKKYIGTSMMASSVSEIVDKVLKDTKHNTVGRIQFHPVVLNEVCSYKLMNSERFL